METKICTKCSIEKPIDDFGFRDKEHKHCVSQCKTCLSQREKLWRDNNKTRLAEYNKQYRQDNLNKLTQYGNEYNIKFYKQHNKTRNQNYYIKNKDKIKARKIKNREKWNIVKNKRRQHRQKTDVLFKFVSGIRVKFYKIFKYNGYTKSTKTQEILGCSYQEFIQHLEKQFEPWMNWENRGKYNGEFNYGWDIDHIIPLSTAKTEDDIIKLNHYTNLQPLDSKINRDIKRNFLIY